MITIKSESDVINLLKHGYKITCCYYGHRLLGVEILTALRLMGETKNMIQAISRGTDPAVAILPWNIFTEMKADGVIDQVKVNKEERYYILNERLSDERHQKRIRS